MERVTTELFSLPTDDAKAWAAGVRELVGRVQHRRDVVATALYADEQRAPAQLRRLLRLQASTDADVDALRRLQAECRHLQDQMEQLVLDKASGDLFRRLEASLTLEKGAAYAAALHRVAELHEELKAHLGHQDWERLGVSLGRTRKLADSLSASHCHRLADYAAEFAAAWRGHAEARIRKHLDAVLETLGWPFDSLQAIDETSPKVCEVAALLACLCRCQEDETSEPPYLQPLFEPFRTRFRFHFYGERKTNDVSRPEWFLSQTLEWLGLHRDFVRVHLQSALPCAEQPLLFPRLTTAMVQLPAEKIRSLLPSVRDDAALFSHLIDEVLAFETELRELGLTGESACLSALTEGEGLELWIGLEREANTERAEALLSAPEAWLSRCDAAEDLDDHKVPSCVEAFLLLLQYISSRFRLLPPGRGRSSFLSLQLGLLDDFRLRLVQLVRQCESPWDAPFPQLLNALPFIAAVLDDWDDLPLYVRLMGDKLGDRDRGEEDDTPAAPRVLEGAFAGMRSLYELMWQQMQTDVVECAVQSELKPTLSRYFAEKWYALETSDGVSGTLCPFLLKLGERLGWLRANLASATRRPVLQALATQTLALLQRDLVSQTAFNFAGGSQLSYDLLCAVIPVFKSHGVSGLESSGAELVESVRVLGLPVPTALLLADTIDQSQGEEIAGLSSEFDLETLSKAQVRQLLKQRVDLPLPAKKENSPK